MLTIHRPFIDRGLSTEWIGPAPWITVTPPGPQALQAVARDRRVTSTASDRPYPLVVRRAQGSIVEDVDRNRYLDFTAGMAVCSTGHCHAQVVHAVEDQAKLLLHMCGGHFYYEPMIALSEKLVQITPGPPPKRVILTNSGSEAVETAIKLARHHTGRRTIVSFYNSFHGRTMGALSLTAHNAVEREGFGPLVPMVQHVPYGDLAALRQLFRRVAAPAEVAAVFVEPIQAEGGVILPPQDFLPKLRALCDQHGILLVVDEVQTGLGRTGRMFCCEHFDIVPDILILAGGLASGLPLGAVIAAESIVNCQAGGRASTGGGNPVSCAAALATIELLERQYTANAARLQPIALDKLHRISSRHKRIAAPRGLGLMLAVDAVRDGRSREPDPDLRDRIVSEAFGRGVLLLGCGESAIRISPPLCINRVQLEIGLDVFEEAIATVLG
jgi:4-aminobutyrate aminotransferase